MESLVNQWPWATKILVLVGVLNLAKLAFKSVRVFTQTFILPGTSLKKFGAKKGSWAVITGATDGIGREFALQLAKAGFNVYLASRNQDKLDAVSTEIVEKYGVSVKIYPIDFARPEAEAYGALTAACSALDIGVLVNNVGKSHAMPTDFVETPQAEIDAIVAININATLRMTSIVLPGMIQRKRGLILNLGSFAGSTPSPMLATYSASKAFLATFTAALAPEVAPHNIVIEHLNTYFVVSKMSKIRRPSAFVPSPAQYVRTALSKIALPCGAASTHRPHTSTPYWSHALLDYIMGVAGLTGVYVGYTHRLHKDIRRRALRKLEREAIAAKKD